MATTYTHSMAKTLQTPSGVLSYPVDYTGSYALNISEDVSTGQTNYQITVAIDVSAIKSIFIVSDQNVLLETNSGSSPAESINLLAGVPYEWATGSYFTNLLATDITALFITNASGSTATINIACLLDATP